MISAFTIVARNYLPMADLLARSYRAAHPGRGFTLVLLEPMTELDRATFGGATEILVLSDRIVPGYDEMRRRYSVLELATAVKPFVFAHLFHDVERLIYLDPDIYVFQPLAEVDEALQTEDIVLTPHLRRPFYDDRHPGDRNILVSGSFNLGFLGLRRGPTVTEFLGWWMEKLYRDCRVALAEGLFVDQKWIDLVPGLFERVRILRTPSYNAAYWNLHDRVLTEGPEGFLIDGAPLVFFHFSGFDPEQPARLSRHQNRHAVHPDTPLHRLLAFYARALLANHHREWARLAPGWSGRPAANLVPPRLRREIRILAAEKGLALPDPLTDPARYGALVTRPGGLGPRGEAPVVTALLRLRPDLRAAFPTWAQDPVPLVQWIRNHGSAEEALADLIAFYDPGGWIIPQPPVPPKSLLARLLPARAPEHAFGAALRGLDATPASWDRALRAYQALLLSRGIRLERHDLQTGVRRALFAFLASVLRSANATRKPDITGLRQHLHDLLSLPPDQSPLSEGDALYLKDFLDHAPDWITAVLLLYHPAPPPQEGGEGWLVKRAKALGIALTPGLLRVLKTAGVTDGAVAGARPSGSTFRMRANLAGYFAASSGMGESARSLGRVLRAGGAETRDITLPQAISRHARAGESPLIFGWPMAGADLSITVANADSVAGLRDVLPLPFPGRRNIGYWVWETENPPLSFRNSQDGFDQIWTPSRYARDAMAPLLDRPLHVVPHALDLEALSAARPDRARHGLPPDKTLFGFFFDPQSVLERKNVLGLIRSFKAAFRDDDGCCLVLKANVAGLVPSLDFARVCQEAEDPRILLIRDDLPRQAVFDLMASLDVYASLHRSEGFGLTCAEAMALGLPVVASGYSGNLDFMTPENSLLVPTTVYETERAYGAYPAGTRWGAPDPEAAADAFRRLLDPGLRQDLGARGAAAVRTQLNPANVFRAVQQALAD